MELKEIIEKHNIPDKPDFHATTSYKFKEDLFYFFQSIGSEDLICTEFGTSRGFTTVMLSYLFKEVHTVNLKQGDLTKELISGLDNIHLHEFNLYSNSKLPTPKSDVFIIDAGHNYRDVISDTKRAIENSTGKSFLIFDDFGGFPPVRKAILDILAEGKIGVVKFIGMNAGWKYGEEAIHVSRTLTHQEGVICQIL